MLRRKKEGRWRGQSENETDGIIKDTEKKGHIVRARTRVGDKQVDMESGSQKECEREKREGVTYESEREKVREDTESDGTKGSCALDGNQVC